MKKIIVVGLGAGDFDQLPLGVYKRLKSDVPLFYVQKNTRSLPNWQKKG